MALNVNQPSFISFLETLTNNILSHISVIDYFTLSQESKLSVQYVTIRLIKGSIKLNMINDDELKGFIVVLRKKNEESEHYEFAEILNDIVKNFDTINEFTKLIKKEITVKTEKSTKKT
jgi:hypothetical protein